MESLDKILKLVDRELDSVSSNGKFKSRDDVEMVYKLIDIAKDVYCIWDYEDSEGGASYAGPYYGGSYRGESYDGGTSYARGRGRNTRRDSMGRYSRRGYSMADGKTEYIERLRDVMDSAPDEMSKQKVERMIREMESM